MWSAVGFVNVKSRCSFFHSLSYLRMTIDGGHHLKNQFTSFITNIQRTFVYISIALTEPPKTLPVTFVNIRELFPSSGWLWNKYGAVPTGQPHRSPCAENDARRPT